MSTNPSFLDNEHACRELVRLMCGERLGGGSARSVYVFSQDPSLVIKVEEEAGSFQNVIEWDTWCDVKDTVAVSYFAPCIAISPSGLVLLQRRTFRPDSYHYPEKMPAFLCDFKRGNYGLLDGALVCHDYGLNMLRFHSINSKRTQKVVWRDEE